MSEANPKSGLVPTINERLRAYQQCPALLIEELEFIFIENMDPVHVALHRKAMDKLKQFYPDRERFLKTVARAIIHTVRERQ